MGNSILDQLEEKTVDTRTFADDSPAVIDDYQWHLQLALPSDSPDSKCDEILSTTGVYITQILSCSRAITDCIVTGICLHDEPGKVYERDRWTLASGIKLEIYSDGDLGGPCITIGLTVVRTVSLRCLMRLLYMISAVQKHICDKLSYGNKVKIDYDGPDARKIQEFSSCLECWLDRDFTETSGDVRLTTEFVLYCFGYELFEGPNNTKIYGREKHPYEYYARCNFETRNFNRLPYVRKYPGLYTLRMDVSLKSDSVIPEDRFPLEISSPDRVLTYFRYYVLACIISSLFDRIKISKGEYRPHLDSSYAQQMRLLADWTEVRESRRPEQVISYQRVYDQSAIITERFLKTGKELGREMLEDIADYINKNLDMEV